MPRSWTGPGQGQNLGNSVGPRVANGTRNVMPGLRASPGCVPVTRPGIMRPRCSVEGRVERAGLHRDDQRHGCQVTSMSLFAFVWQVCGDGCFEPGGNTIG